MVLIPRTIVVGIDPGLKRCGWAVCDEGQLVSAGITQIFSNDITEICELHLQQINKQYVTLDATHIVIERMQKDGRDWDVMDLNVIAGWLGHSLGADAMPQPRDWKGGVKKEVHQARMLKKLSDHERSIFDSIPKTYRHNAIDAWGIALWGYEKFSRQS